MTKRYCPEAIRAQLARILGSRTFARSERLARFLKFTVEQTLEGHADQLKEFVVGVEVFDKRDTYDPRIDPIVRVEARRLRQKLRKYYESEGSGDPIVIEFPKGSYAPLLRPAEATPPFAGPAPSTRRGIAVLPFVNLSREADNDYFSDGLTEELINALTRVDGLRVVAWSSAVRLKGKTRDVARIGEQLNVDVILEGSVRATPGKLRITAQMIDVRDGSYLWSETFERECRDVFAVQDEIASAIVGTLRGRLGAPQPVARRTEHIEAYHLYLKGRFYWNKRNEESVLRGIDYFEQAVLIDPGWAPAYAGLADSYIVLGKFGVAPARDVMPKARHAAERALEIDPTLAEAHVSLGSVAAGYDWDWAAAEAHYRRAIELNPGYATAHQWYAYDLLSASGRLGEAEMAMRRARECDPLSIVILASAAEVFAMTRQPERAIDLYHSVLELEPQYARAYLGLGRSMLELGRQGAAVEAIEKAAQLQPGSPVHTAVLAGALGMIGEMSRARKLIAQLERTARERYVAPYLFMRAWAGLDAKRSIDYLARAVEERDPRIVHINVSPVYDPLRGDARFQALVDKMGLLQRETTAA